MSFSQDPNYVNFKRLTSEYWLLFLRAILLSNEFTAKIPLEIILALLFFLSWSLYGL